MPERPACCHAPGSKPDYLLWGALAALAPLYAAWFFAPGALPVPAAALARAVFEIFNTMAWGLAAGIVFVGLLSFVPREFVLSILGSRPGAGRILRAAVAGVLLDLCSHGILLVGSKLYERGASLGQVFAFLIASPWNSFSLTLVMWAMLGAKWTLLFIALSLAVAVIAGVVCDGLLARSRLPANPNPSSLPENFAFLTEAKKALSGFRPDARWLWKVVASGVRESRMVVRWLLLGVFVAACVRAFVPGDVMQAYLGPTLLGLGLTMVAATVIEVCSEGSLPIAAEIMTRAHAPGNAFAFLMAGVSTDYTEILVLREVTRSWKAALFLPLLTLPQIALLAWWLNAAG